MKAKQYSVKYMVRIDRMGFYTITRLSDKYSIYLQGDDAKIFDGDYIAIGNVWSKKRVKSVFSCCDEHVDYLCEQYDDVMEKTVNMYL